MSSQTDTEKKEEAQILSKEITALSRFLSTFHFPLKCIHNRIHCHSDPVRSAFNPSWNGTYLAMSLTVPLLAGLPTLLQLH